MAAPSEQLRPPARPARPRGAPLAVAACFVLACVTANAWVCDDAFITWRSVEALLRGDGLTWNPGSRVQVFTHPLWLFGLAGGGLLVDDLYAVTIGLGLLCTAAALGCLARLTERKGAAAWLPMLALGLSPSFVQFSSSGLENPLTHALLGLLLLAAVKRRRPLWLLALLAAALAVNRMDTLLLALPLLLADARRHWRERGLRRTAAALAAGFAPLVLWVLFALVYFGSPLPNTAYAKLAHGLPRDELVVQGGSYLASFATFDPVGAAVVAAALGLTLRERRRGASLSLVAYGALLYVGYVVWIGGDFMAGRMLTPVVFLAAGLLATSPRWAALLEGGGRRTLAIATALVLLGTLPQSHVATAPGKAWDLPVPPGPLELHSTHWVDDEQHHYLEATGLLFVVRRGETTPRHGWYRKGERWGAEGGVHVIRNVGMTGYAAGARAHIVDSYGLAEPLLARLPAWRNPHWHVGHFQRVVPDGYARSIEEGRCVMDDEELCELFADTRLVTRGPLLSSARLEAIWDLLAYAPSERLAARLRAPPD